MGPVPAAAQGQGNETKKPDEDKGNAVGLEEKKNSSLIPGSLSPVL